MHKATEINSPEYQWRYSVLLISEDIGRIETTAIDHSFCGGHIWFKKYLESSISNPGKLKPRIIIVEVYPFYYFQGFDSRIYTKINLRTRPEKSLKNNRYHGDLLNKSNHE